MNYTADPGLQKQYSEIATLFAGDVDPARAMSMCEVLLAGGEEASWASVWWAYGAIHFLLTDEAYERGLELLTCVEGPREAIAAARMLAAEIEYTRALEKGRTPSAADQLKLLSEAASLASDWPSVHLRRAYSLRGVGAQADAKHEALTAIRLLDESDPTCDPFDTCFTGRNLDREYAASELKSFPSS